MMTFKFTTPQFILPLRHSGSAMLEYYPVVESITPTLVYRYTGSGVQSGSWVADIGNNLDETGSGTAPTLNKPAPFTLSGEYAVGYSYGKYHQESGPTSTYGNIDDVGTVYDFILEAAVKMPPEVSSDEVILAKWDEATSTGYKLWREASTRTIKLTIGDGTSTVDIDPSGGYEIESADDSTWYFYIFYVDRDSSGAFNVNGNNNATVNVSGIGNIYTTDLLTIGANSSAPLQEFGGEVTYLALYRSTNPWLDIYSAEHTRFVRERTCKLWGTYPTYAEGQQYPTTMERGRVVAGGGTAMLDIYSETDGYSYGHLVGWHWNRVCKRVSKYGNAYQGFLSEVGSGTGSTGYNRIEALAAPEDFSDAGWTKTGSTVTSDAISSPIGDMIGDAINGTDVDESHGVEVESTDGSGWLTIFAKKGEVDFLYIESSNALNPSGSQWCYFDLTNGTVGSYLLYSGGHELRDNFDAYMMYEFQGGWFRCGIGCYNGNPTTFKFYAVSTDQGVQGPTYTATTSPQIYLWGAQHNQFMNGVASYRRKASEDDDLQFSATDNMGPQDEEGLIKFSSFSEGNQNQDLDLLFNSWAGGDIQIGTSYVTHPSAGEFFPAPSAYISWSLQLKGDSTEPDGKILNDGYEHEIAFEWRPNSGGDWDDMLYIDGTRIDNSQGVTNQGTSLETMKIGNEFIGLLWDFEVSTLDDITIPVLANRSPAASETGVDRLTNVVFDIVDPDSSIDPSSISISVGGSSAYQSGSFVGIFDSPGSSVTPTSIVEGDGYHIVIDRSGWYTSGSSVEVEIFAQNNARAAVDTSYSFTCMSTNGPDGYDPYPTDGYLNTDRGVTADVIIVDGYYPIDPDTVKVTIEGNVAYELGSFVSPYDGPGSMIIEDSYGGKDGYRVYVDKIGVYANSSSVEFKIEATDITDVNDSSTFHFTTENDITKNIGVSIEEGQGNGFVPAYDGSTGTFVTPYNGTLSQMYPDSSDGYDGYNFVVQKDGQWGESVRVTIQVGNASFENTMGVEFEGDLFNESPEPFSVDVSRNQLAQFRIRISQEEPEEPELGPDWEVFSMGGGTGGGG